MRGTGRIHFVSFADRRFAPSLRLIGREAERFICFESVRLHSERDLSPEFRTMHRDFIRASDKGYGYWIWKPQVLLQTLSDVRDHDVVVYADAGCSLRVSGEPRMLEYAALARGHPSGILGFVLHSKERQFTKRDVLEHHSFVGETELEAKQIGATAMIVENRRRTRDFIRRWQEACEVYRLLDDSPSDAANDPEFIAHRHDQSHFSILFKKEGGLSLPDETRWEEEGKYPIHARRRKLMSRSARIRNRLIGAFRG